MKDSDLKKRTVLNLLLKEERVAPAADERKAFHSWQQKRKCCRLHTAGKGKEFNVWSQ